MSLESIGKYIVIPLGVALLTTMLNRFDFALRIEPKIVSDTQVKVWEVADKVQPECKDENTD